MRRQIAVFGTAVGVGIFWAAIVSVIVQTTFGISKNVSFFFIGIPVAGSIVALLWPKLPKILGFHDSKIH
jgi:hypothetical protein